MIDMSTAIKELTSWPVEDRVRLVEWLCDSIDADSEAAPVTEAQKQELSRRLADHLAHPACDSLGSSQGKSAARVRS